MNCEIVQIRNVVERYVLGQLSDPERDLFEEHFFACDPCLEEVRLLQSLQGAVAAQSHKAVSMPAAKWLLWGAMAAFLIAAFGLAGMRWQRHYDRPAPAAVPIAAGSGAGAGDDRPGSLQLLARVEPPRYTPSNLRSTSGDYDQNFRLAMDLYTRGEYAGAAQALRELAGGGPESAAARFYLAISDLLTGNPDEAVNQLRSTVAFGGGPYQEEARFFLAKALLAQRDVAGAVRALEQTAALAGDREAESRRLLQELRALPAKP